MRFKVVVTNPVFPETREILEELCDVDINPGPEPWPVAEVRARCSDADALLAFMTDCVDAGFLEACPRLKVVACALKGWDNFDVEACTRSGIWLTAVPDLLTEPTAELAVGLAIGLCRNVVAGDRAVRASFDGWRPRLYGSGLYGSVVGVAGMGKVGRAITRRLKGFGARELLYFDEQALPASAEAELGACRVSWDTLVGRSDLLILALPLTPDTRHMLDAAALAAASPGLRIVNAGRGSVVDEAAVAEALAEGRLGGYAADVFEMEDWALDDRPRRIAPGLLTDEDRTLFTPHLGSGVVDTRRRIEAAAAHNLLDALKGLVPADAINHPDSLRGFDGAN
ncbi:MULTISPECIES: phosphonate dehydrogenase [Methylobacteriaceae]|jgi:phosphonate dehydrogenase|uniref:Phosphonate dehydrogenase n=3 Tax=Pseudomonadota TaxID=1224 RepID=A0ABU9ZJP9_9HYPH|nr:MULTISPECIES: phosphonate dehydrogenase [Methylobacteriaceae]MBY0141447.1 hydroxyacid dehydrogenase [Methylorubrum populi]MCX7332295.1 phosphonate dehydrogenase [Hyphomicrobiales bacterium]MBB5764355.1 phosphonate dehydrogenase [Methylorubrum rhodesianum]MBI1689934.1 hydroxyacid dehydrogenase [Methylorubrum sp. DB1722]MBK3402629.1 hydroxyacid dehydrogenase [Methylorubrum rhodesianum]